MKRITIASLVLFAVCGLTAQSTPPIWQSDYGVLVPPADPDSRTPLPGLVMEDDAVTAVDLSFFFPFEGIAYERVYVGTNGCVQLGSTGLDGELDYDLWEYFEEFYDDAADHEVPAPVICPFNSDLDNSSDGRVWVNDLGDRVMFTWDEVGTHFKETHHLTFQLQLFEDGTIVFGYNGVLDNEGETVAASSEGGSLDEGIVIGISRSDGTCSTPELDYDLNGPYFAGGDTIFQRWCYDEANSCGENEKNLGYMGWRNVLWDLENQNVIFQPRWGGGFHVHSSGSEDSPRVRPLRRGAR